MQPNRTMGFDRVWLGVEGVPPNVRDRLEEAGVEVLTLPHDRPWEAPGAGELVLVSATDPVCAPFLLCTRLKDPGRARVWVLLCCPESDRAVVAPLARFAMADAVAGVERLAADPLAELGSFLARPQPAESVDVLLARLEDRLGGDARALADRVVSGLSRDREQSFVESVTDTETGLFDGPFMAFKLEEEFKRAWRFHSPLAVLLVDLPRSRDLGGERGRVLAEVAGVFLNECRDIDVLGRYGDTSFLLLLPNTGRQGATVLAERILAVLSSQIVSPGPLEPAVAIVTVPRTGIERKDDLLDLARLTLVAAWAADGAERVQIAE